VKLMVSVVPGEHDAALRSLREWLAAEPALRGQVRLVEPAPRPGTLGGVVEALQVVLGPGGVAPVFAGALVAWARRRVGDAEVMVTRPDGTSVTVKATNVRGLDGPEMADLVAGVARSLEESSEETDGTGG
jgi:hypothetical protein